METIEQLQQKIVEKSGLPVQEVADLITHIREETKTLFGTLSPEEFEKRMMNRTVSFFRKFISTPGDLVEALPLLDSGILYRNRGKINQVLNDIGTDKIKLAQAIAQKKVMQTKDNLLVLDQDALLKNGKPNSNHGKPLIEASFRTVQGVFVDKDGGKKRFILSLNSDECNYSISMRQPIKMYTTRAKDNSLDGSVRLYLKSGTKSLPGTAQWDINAEADALFSSRLLDISNFDSALEAIKNKTESNLFLIKGTVTNINLEREKKSIRIQQGGGLDDVASEIYVKIPDNLADEAALIAPWSEAYVVGQIWKMPPFEAGGEDFRAITAQTIWSNEKVVNAPPISASTLVPQSDEKDFA